MGLDRAASRGRLEARHPAYSAVRKTTCAGGLTGHEVAAGRDRSNLGRANLGREERLMFSEPHGDVRSWPPPADLAGGPGGRGKMTPKPTLTIIPVALLSERLSGRDPELPCCGKGRVPQRLSRRNED